METIVDPDIRLRTELRWLNQPQSLSYFLRHEKRPVDVFVSDKKSTHMSINCDGSDSKDTPPAIVNKVDRYRIYSSELMVFECQELIY